jgi:HD domain
MPIPSSLFVHHYFPNAEAIPFGDSLNHLFFVPRGDNPKFVIHGPNVVRLTKALLELKLGVAEPGLLAGTELDKDRTRRAYLKYYSDIYKALEIDEQDQEKLERTELFISVAALYHDIGKTIRRANHPQIGANLLRNSDQQQSNLLVNALQYHGEPDDHESKHHRFSLICSTTQHHDKFGVVSTGEGALPIFSDILYFTSNEKVLEGIKKNVTSVMLLNLGDIAAVVPGTVSQKDVEEAELIAEEIGKCRKGQNSSNESELLTQLTSIIEKPSCCLGLKPRKVHDVLNDWHILVESIGDPEVQGIRGRLKRRLLSLEQNPARTIQRILRLLIEAIETSNAQPLTSLMSPTLVESILVGALGSHQFQNFCRQFASAVKLDYGLNFFKAIVCACARKTLHGPDQKAWPRASWDSLSLEEATSIANIGRDRTQDITTHITSLFVKVLHGVTTRYAGILESGGLDARRFGFQMRDLTSDPKIREAIIDLLCVKENKDHVALTWIADEVTIWSMD